MSTSPYSCCRLFLPFSSPSSTLTGTFRYTEIFLEIILAVSVDLISFHQCCQFYLFVSLSISVIFLSCLSAVSISVVLWSHLIQFVSICSYLFLTVSKSPLFLLLLFSLLSDLLSVFTDRNNRELDNQTRSYSIE